MTVVIPISQLVSQLVASHSGLLADLTNLAAVPTPPPPGAPYRPGVGGADKILNDLSWAASAAGVFGLIIIGIQMSLQFRRGEMGEGATHFRGFFIVVGACIVSASAAPLVQTFGPFGI